MPIANAKDGCPIHYQTEGPADAHPALDQVAEEPEDQHQELRPSPGEQANRRPRHRSP
jgi:hypothetical protein